MHEGLPEFADEQPSRGRGIHISWYVLLVLGWLLYEATSQPELAAAVTCAKFGWSDWRAAWWLRRVDPDWRRGRTCFWFYLSYGLWKVAMTASVVMFFLLLAGSMLRRKPAWVPQGGGMSPAVAGVLIAAGVGFGLSFFATYVSVWSALRHGVKVWLGAAPHLARTQKYWPPASGQQNAAPFVAVTTLIITLGCVVFGVGMLGMALGPALAGILPIVALLAVTSPLTVFVLKYLERRVFARKPEECWPPDELEAVYQADD